MSNKEYDQDLIDSVLEGILWGMGIGLGIVIVAAIILILVRG